MKTKFIISFLYIICFAKITFAQVTIEHTYQIQNPNNFYVTDIGNNNFKYVYIDTSVSFSVYNIDHTPFLTGFVPPVSIDWASGRSVGYITTSLFDCDSTTLEYAVLPAGSTPTQNFYIYRTDGTLLFSRDSCIAIYCYGCIRGAAEMRPIINTPDGAKLFLTKWPFAGEVSVYSLCGTLPMDVSELNLSSNYISVYPNPSIKTMNFKIMEPSNIEVFELTIYNSSMQVLSNTKMERGTELFTLDCSNYSSGDYFFSLQSSSRVWQTGKFIITK